MSLESSLLLNSLVLVALSSVTCSNTVKTA